MAQAMTADDGHGALPPSRRDFLYLTTGATFAVGAAGVVWPLIDQMNPDADTLARGGPIDIDLSPLGPGQQIVVKWQEHPIFIVRRTPEALKSLREPSLLSRLRDPDSQERQQPPYADNWSRSINPEILVLVGVCTHLGCIPEFFPKPDSLQASPTGRAATSAPATARATIWPAACSRACPRPTTCPFRRIISPRTRCCASARIRRGKASASATSSRCEPQALAAASGRANAQRRTSSRAGASKKRNDRVEIESVSAR